MPFKSNKQRRYLWANEPEIARDWTNKYGSRVRKYEGGIMDNILSFGAPFATYFSGGNWAPRTAGMDTSLKNIITNQGTQSGTIGYSDYDRSQAPGTSMPNLTSAFKDVFTGKLSPQDFANMNTLGRLNYDINPEGSIKWGSNKFNFRPEVAEDMGLFSKWANRTNRAIEPNIMMKGYADDNKGGIWGAAQARDYTAGEHYNMTPDDITRAMQTQGPDQMRRQTSVPTSTALQFSNPDDFTGIHDPSVFDKWGNIQMAEEKLNQYPQKRGNIFKKGWQGIKKGWQGAKDFKTSIGEGITGILDNSMFGKFAAMNDATNPRAFNYNPALQGQIDYLKGRGDYGVMDASGLNKITGGVLAGKNLQSLFGSNDLGKMYDKSIALTQKTIKNFDKQWSTLKKDDPDEYYKKLAFHQNKLKQKIEEKKLADKAAADDLERRKTESRKKWQKDYSTWTSPSGRDHAATAGIGSKESKQGPAGGSIGASRFLARGGRASYFNGGLASLWPR